MIILIFVQSLSLFFSEYFFLKKTKEKQLIQVEENFSYMIKLNKYLKSNFMGKKQTKNRL